MKIVKYLSKGCKNACFVAQKIDIVIIITVIIKIKWITYLEQRWAYNSYLYITYISKYINKYNNYKPLYSVLYNINNMLL